MIGVLNPEGCKPLKSSSIIFKEYYLSDVLKKNGSIAIAIEPAAQEHFIDGKTKISIKYKIALSVEEDASDDCEVPFWVILDNPNYIDGNNDIYRALWYVMMDDLILRYYQEEQNPIWIAAIKQNTTVFVKNVAEEY